MLTQILGWYSLIMYVIAIVGIIATNYASGGRRLASFLIAIPVAAYICITLFQW
ncbi:hypothetical protein [Brevibacillus laterosporus]|uniref:hypothetical protein n=1 Tax=Brevibacillus laterosporus TaxID=1465 RepID=UPI0018CD8130|nr:hypothetical protein [Brevibacillus laterosporus]